MSGDDKPRDMTNANARGRLLDALITCPKNYDSYKKEVVDRYGNITPLTPEQIKLGYKQRDAFFNDPVNSAIHAASEFQIEVINEGVDFDDIVFGCSAIYDGRLRLAKWVWDLKTTSAASQGAFEDVFCMWDWDRQAFFFMEVGEIDRMQFIGVENKHPYKIFRKDVYRGDAIWQSGREKTYDLVMKFNILCANE